MSINVPSNPVELAVPIAEARFTDTSFEGSARDMSDLILLDHMAEKSGLMGKWLLGASRGFITPVSFEADEEITIHDLRGLYFDGEFACFSRVSIGQIIGYGAVRALCMTFPSGTLVMPRFTELDDEDLLHVPVVAVEEIRRSDQPNYI